MPRSTGNPKGRSARKPDNRRTTSESRLSAGVGASDANSGAGNASGTPEADTLMRTNGRAGRGDVARDRAKLFPGTVSGRATSKSSGKNTPGKGGGAKAY